jgi:hypothetical protein
MDQNLNQRKQTLEDKIPDIKKTLAMVEFLQERRVGSSLAEIWCTIADPVFLCRKERRRAMAVETRPTI